MDRAKNKKGNSTSITKTLLDNVEEHKNKRLAEKIKSSNKLKINKKQTETNTDLLEAKLKNDMLTFNEKGL